MELVNYFLNLYKNKKQIAILCYAYLFLAIIFVIIAGICALVNQDFGVKMLFVPIGAIGVLTINIVVWALIRFAIEASSEHLEEKRAEQKKLSRNSKK